MSFTAYAQLSLPQVAEAFTHLGFPAYFRVELSLAKLLSVLLLLAPVPARLKGYGPNLGYDYGGGASQHRAACHPRRSVTGQGARARS
jgi:hypothetical protein